MATSKGRRAIEVKRSAPDSPPLPFPDASGEEGDGTKTLAELAYRRIRDLIIAGDLAPDEKLRIEYLRRALDIGASPLREALSRLSSHGIVEMEGQRGFRVAPVSLPALWDITETRLLLEGHALRRSIERGDDTWEASVVAAYHRLHRAEQRRQAAFGDQADAWESRDRDFHETLVAECGQPLLLRLRRSLCDQHERYRRLTLMRLPAERDLAHEHRAIMDAALARNADEACRLSDEHIMRTAMAIAAILAGQSPRSTPSTA